MTTDYSCSQHPKRRWYQFTLKTLLLAVLLVSIAMSWISGMYHQARREKAAADKLDELGADLDDWIGLRELFLGQDHAPIVEANLSHLQDIHAALKHVEVLASLEYLNLSDTAIVDSDLKYLKRLRRLRSLCLSNTQVTDAGLEHLENLRSLRWLALGNTQVTPAGVTKLRQKLPYTEVTLSQGVGTRAHLVSSGQLRRFWRRLGHLVWRVRKNVWVTKSQEDQPFPSASCDCVTQTIPRTNPTEWLEFLRGIIWATRWKLMVSGTGNL